MNIITNYNSRASISDFYEAYVAVFTGVELATLCECFPVGGWVTGVKGSVDKHVGRTEWEEPS